MKRADEGLPKMWTIYQAFQVRRGHAAAFGEDGEYVPLAARGPKANHVVAFSRGGNVVVVVPRLVLKLGGKWGDTSLELPEGNWRNKLSGAAVQGGRVKLADLLRAFPVALLVKQ
jgi:(1->4)-alpha-D-glucan 1-alpha-D-glucosylmutase